jgi:hypothetical protein
MTLKLKIGPTFRTQTLRLVHRLGGELRMALSFTLGLALLHHFVASVISHGPKFQMVRITAGWVVAFMTNDHSDGNLAFVNYVRNAMERSWRSLYRTFPYPLSLRVPCHNQHDSVFSILSQNFFSKGLPCLKLHSRLQKYAPLRWLTCQRGRRYCLPHSRHSKESGPRAAIRHFKEQVLFLPESDGSNCSLQILQTDVILGLAMM